MEASPSLQVTALPQSDPHQAEPPELERPILPLLHSFLLCFSRLRTCSVYQTSQVMAEPFPPSREPGTFSILLLDFLF